MQGRKVTSKQKRIGEIVAELVGKNEFIRPDGELFVHRKMVSLTPDAEIKTNIALLQKAIMQSLQEGIGHAANSYLSMVVANLTDHSAFPVSFLVEKWKQRTQESLFPDIWKVYCIDQLIATSRQKMAKPGFGVPYTVYPLPADFVSALVTGYFYVHYRLNTDAVVKALRDASFEVKSFLADERTSGNQPIPDNKRLSYFQVKRGRITLTIHTLPIEQLLFDGLPLEEFVASIVAQCDAEEEKTENQMKSDQSEENVRRFHSMSTYTSMEKLWSMSRWADL